MTLLQYLYDLKNTISGGISTNELSVSDRQLEFHINNIRAVMIRRELEKNRSINPDVVQDLGCLELECVNSVECCNLHIKSKNITRTKYKLPKTVELAQANAITYVGLVDSVRPVSFTSIHQAQWGQYNKWTASSKHSFLLNGYLYVTDPNLKFIKVRGIFENPREAHEFAQCDGCKKYTNDLKDFEYPLGNYIWSMTKSYILQYDLGVMLGATKDIQNNSLDGTGIQQGTGNKEKQDTSSNNQG